MGTAPLALIGFSEVMAEGIKGVLSRSPFRIRLQCQTVDELLGSCSHADGHLSCILIDTRRHSTVTDSALARLRLVRAKAKIVLIIDESELCEIVAIAREADGAILSSSSATALVKTLELILLGQRVYPADVFAIKGVSAPTEKVESGVIQQPPQELTNCAETKQVPSFPHKLSDREVEVTKLLCNGAPNKVIARHLGISEATVKVHVKAILRKTQARNRTEAALIMTSMMRPAAGLD